jgi:histidyl-tRNA synthetase
MHDVLPPDSAAWAEAVTRFARLADRYGYGLAVTPILEHAEVFRRIGEHTDVIAKEMYELTDRSGRHLALRPEGTASVVRAYVEHRPTPPWKVWYVAPNFRYERPQRGRYRQHWQLGVEAIGAADPELDVECIALAWATATDLGIPALRLLVNSMGDAEERPGYLEVLRAHLRRAGAGLGAEFLARVEANPLRVLDAKDPDWQEVIERAPQLAEHLGAGARAHFEAVQAGLRDLGIPYELAPRLVRGFDYYTRTTFELQTDALDAAQNAVGGGGRYDRLVEEMGGPATPAIGFAMGVERLVLASGLTRLAADRSRLDAFVIDALGPDGAREAILVLAELRAAGLRADRAYGGRSLKGQWRAADRARARYGVMLAPAELARGAVVVKDLGSGRQVEVGRSALVGWLQARAAPTGTAPAPPPTAGEAVGP